MVVKRKVLKTPEDSGSIDLSADLKKVRAAISTLPTDEELMNQEAAATETKKAVKKAAAKKPAKKIVKKVATKVEPAKKANGGDQVALSDLCAKLKIEPSAARRQLRKAEIENPGRWTWAKDSSALKKVTELLSA